MQNNEINNIINNLKGRKKYEEKKAFKLGFNSLYEYFEHKILQHNKLVEAEKKRLELIKNDKKLVTRGKVNKKTCGCC